MTGALMVRELKRRGFDAREYDMVVTVRFDKSDARKAVAFSESLITAGVSFELNASDDELFFEVTKGELKKLLEA